MQHVVGMDNKQVMKQLVRASKHSTTKFITDIKCQFSTSVVPKLWFSKLWRVSNLTILFQLIVLMVVYYKVKKKTGMKQLRPLVQDLID